MNRLEFSDEEVELLEEILKAYQETLEYEISRADNLQFKSLLKRRRDSVGHLIERCRVPTGLAA